MFCGLHECARNQGGQCLIAQQISLNERGVCKYAANGEALRERRQEAIKERYEVLRAMNTLTRFCNDERFYFNHWVYVVPDGADDEELLEIAKEDVATFNEAVQVFNKYFWQYVAVGGLYIGGEVYPKK